MKTVKAIQVNLLVRPDDTMDGYCMLDDGTGVLEYVGPGKRVMSISDGRTMVTGTKAEIDTKIADGGLKPKQKYMEERLGITLPPGVFDL